MPLELATSRMFGEESSVPVLPEVHPDLSPVLALETAVLPALRRRACVVSFSGGRDSAVVLAVAARVARREGLAPPVPVTLRFPGVGEAEESRWQERVIRHLDLQDWCRRPISGDELDWLGPLSRRMLRRHGILYPPSVFWWTPMLEEARGGSLLTGLGGDELFDEWPWAHRVERAATHRARVTTASLMFAHRLLPVAVRRGLIRSDRTAARLRQGPQRHLGRHPPWPWLRPEAERAALRRWWTDKAAEPARWDARTRWLPRQRELAATQWSTVRLAGDFEVAVEHPLLNLQFLATVARLGKRFGFGERTSVTRALFGDLLPDGILSRPSKATFVPAFWTSTSLDFAAAWDGSGVPVELVDLDRLRAHWTPPGPRSFRSALLLQSAWLTASSGGPAGRGPVAASA
jgi:asparagine synthase (glutamine-hydrolysing)